MAALHLQPAWGATHQRIRITGGANSQARSTFSGDLKGNEQLGVFIKLPRMLISTDVRILSLIGDQPGLTSIITAQNRHSILSVAIQRLNLFTAIVDE